MSGSQAYNERHQREIDAAMSFGLTGVHQDATYTVAEVDAMLAFIGRKVGQLREILGESDALAAAGERVGYESAYRILRRGVAQMLELTGDVL